MARKLSSRTGHGCLLLTAAAALLLGTRAWAEEGVRVRTTYAAPTTIDNPFVKEGVSSAPAAPGKTPAAAHLKASPQPIVDIPNRYYTPRTAMRDMAGRWQRRPPASAPGQAGDSPPYDPFEPSSEVAIISDLADDVAVPETAAEDAGTPEIAFTDKTAGRPPEPAFATATASPESCYTAAAKAARYADSLGEIASVIRLCRQGLQYEASPDEAAALRRLAAWAYNRRGEFHAAAKREDEAMQDFQAAIRLDPQCALALQNRAITYAQRGQTEAALRDFDRAVEANPGLAIAHRNRGELLASLGRTEEAVSDYGQAIIQWPEDAELYKMRGHAFHRLGQSDKALLDLTRAIELAPEHAADSYTLRGNVQAERGRYSEALEDYQRALKCDRACATAYRSKAWLLATCPDEDVRHPARALVAARQAQKLAGADDCYVLEALAAAYASNGRFDEAVRAQRRAVAQAPAALADESRRRLARYRQHRPLVNRATSDVHTASLETETSTR